VSNNHDTIINPIAIGEWVDDAPNGNMKVFNFEYLWSEEVTTGTVINGLWHGQVTWVSFTDYDGNEYEETHFIELENGIINDGVDEDGSYLHWEKGDLTRGLDGYADITYFDLLPYHPGL